MSQRIRIREYKTLDEEIIPELTGEYGTVLKEIRTGILVTMDDEKWNDSGTNTLLLYKEEFEYV